jgi:heme oxygenase
MSAHAIVKTSTSAAHSAIEAVFSRFDFADRDSYISFLVTQARVIPAIEAVLGHDADLPAWRPRAALLTRDLDAFGYHLPKPLAVSAPSSLAERFGLLYVIEGSRLGGRLLLRRVSPNFASYYLSATHEPGEWRMFTRALDVRAQSEGATWIEDVVAGASRGFQLFTLSALETFGASRLRSQA